MFTSTADVELHGMSLLQFAVSENNSELIDFLIEKGCDVNRATPKIDFNGVRCKLRHNRRRDRLQLTCIHTAICRKDPELLKTLIRGGADVNLYDTQMCSVLWHAVDTGHVEITRLVLNAPNCHVDFADGLRMTPLHVAAIHGHVDIIKLLLESGAKMEPRQLQGATPLYLSCHYGREGTRHLLQHGCSANLSDHYGMAPLCAAIKHRNPAETVYSLVDAGATASKNQMSRFLQDEEMETEGQLNQYIVEYVQKYINKPRKLKILVSVFIKDILKSQSGGRSILKKFDTLPLPGLLVNYLKLLHI